MSVSKEIIKVLDALAEKFGIAVDWTSKNIIPYIEELCGKYVNYEVVTSIVWLITGIVMIALGFVFIKLFKKYYNMAYDKEKYDYSQRTDYEALSVILGILIAICFIFGTVVMFEQIFDIVTCYTFPEKIILEEVKSIYESMN